MEQQRKLFTIQYDIGASKITFSTYVKELYNKLQQEYKNVKLYNGKNKKRILKIISKKSRFSLIISEKNRNRGHTIVDINIAQIQDNEVKRIEHNLDTIFNNIFRNDVTRF